jgi:DNA transformation protein and related proteins
MSVDAGFIAHLQELLEPLGQISMRRMFGGHGVYCNDVFFAIVIDDQLYVKVDPESRADFIAAGCSAFVYTGKNHPVEMSYWSVPGEALDSADGMRPWAQRGLAAALRKPVAVKRVSRGQRKSVR